MYTEQVPPTRKVPEWQYSINLTVQHVCIKKLFHIISLHYTPPN